MSTQVRSKKEKNVASSSREQTLPGLSPLGLKLWEIRQRAIANGLKLSNAGEIEKEMDKARRHHLDQ